MKGKKFDAAEKHFHDKEIKYKREINELTSAFQDICAVNSQLVEENNKYKEEDSIMKTKYNKLLEYSKLNDEDIKNALEKDESVARISKIINTVYSRYAGL